MAATRHICSLLRSAGLSVVLAIVLLSQLGIGGPLLTLTKQGCGAPCPCDADRAATHAEPDATTHDGPHDGTHRDAHDDCIDCDDCDHTASASQKPANHEPASHARAHKTTPPCDGDTPCEDNCPDCSCSVAHVANLPVIATLRINRTRTITRPIPAADALVSRDPPGVFRPPRSLS